MHTSTTNDIKLPLEELEVKNSDYLKHCFESAEQDLAKGNVVDGKDFLKTL